MTTPEATSPDAMPAWAKQLIQEVQGVSAMLMTIETHLEHINAQLRTIGDVDAVGNPN